ncbi:MAG: ELWxxDGT repeat protein [Thermoanaerobaculia bacterium]
MNRRTRILWLLLTLAPPALASAQTPVLVADLNPDPPAGTPGSDPRQFAAVNGEAVFVTHDPDSPVPAYRLWATDGTAAGTEALALLCEGLYCRPPLFLARTPDLAFYQATDPDGAGATSRVWRTDGTRAGTFPVSGPFWTADVPVQAVALGRRVLLAACDDGSGVQCGLWVTDGSAAGALLVKDQLRVTGMVSIGTRIVMTTSGAEGNGVWLSDGTAAGTVRLKEGFADLLTASGPRAFFMAGGEDFPDELWTTDGSRKGTHLVEVKEPSHRFSRNTRFLKPVPGGIVFVAYGPDDSALNLWKSDGTVKGTRRVTNFQDSELAALGEDQIAMIGDRLFFMAFNVTGPRLWTTRGTPTTAAPVTGCAGGCPALAPTSPLVPVGRRVVFAAEDVGHGVEPWSSDGTGAGTRLLRDLCAGPCDSAPEAFTPHAGKVDFRATWNGVSRLVRTDGLNAVLLATIGDDDGRRLDLADLGGRTFFAGLDPVYGLQPFSTDGTRLGTRKIANLEEAAGSSNPADFTVVGDRLLFTADDGGGRRVWSIWHGLPTALPIPAGATEIEAAGSVAFVAVDRGPAWELWRTDGTAENTVLLATFQDHALSELHAVGSQVLFLVTSTTGEQPVFSFWGSDGTPAGTGPRFDLAADTIQVPVVASLPSGLYLLRRSESQAEILHSGGAAPPERLLRASCDCTPQAVRFFTAEGRDYFTAWGNFSLGLFRTDGTPAGTVQVFPTSSGTQLALNSAISFQGDLYFLTQGFDPPSSIYLGLYRLREGSEPVLLKKLGYPPFGPLDFQFTVLGNRLFFRAWDPEHGSEVWKTDGTAAGTVLVRDIAPGGASSDPDGLVAIGGRLWFSARDATHGRELWVSDGTAAGTRMVADIAAGPLSSAPEGFTLFPFDGRLYFSADDGVHGREPWRVQANAEGPPLLR